MYFKIVGMLATALLVTGCATHSPSLNTVDVTDKDLTNLKSGTACGTYVFNLFGPFGKESIVSAAKNGDIKKIKAIDKNTDNFILFSRNCITVHGE
jgi:hypothetical protein